VPKVVGRISTKTTSKHTKTPAIERDYKALSPGSGPNVAQAITGDHDGFEDGRTADGREGKIHPSYGAYPTTRKNLAN
jgi:hypothetical protein